MKKWKIFSLLLFGLAAVVGAILLVIRALPPEPSEIERLFDGTEVVFIETRGLLSEWRTVSRTRYWQSGTYGGFAELPPIRDALKNINGGRGLAELINVDAVMSAIGDESAVGVYSRDESSRFLLVSRVDPNFLLLDRLAAIAGEDIGITVTTHRGMRVKEAAFPEGGPLWWSLDGDLLILSDDRALFFAALSRHLDKNAGEIAGITAFRELRRGWEDNTLVSGYAVTGYILSSADMGESLPRAVITLMPKSAVFSLSREDGGVTLTVTGEKSSGPLWGLLPERKGTIPPLPDEGLAALSMGNMPLTTSEGASRTTVPGNRIVGFLPTLFPDGFSAFLLGDPAKTGDFVIVGVGKKTGAFFGSIADIVKREGFEETRLSGEMGEITVLEKDAVPYLAWIERGDLIIVSDHPDLRTVMSSENLEKGGMFGYTAGNGESAVRIRPRLIYDELIRSPGRTTGLFLDLSSEQERRLLAAFYPVREITGRLFLGGPRPKLVIDIAMEDTVP